MARFPVVLAALILSLPVWAKPVVQPHIEVDLVSEYNGVVPGGVTWFALSMQPEPGWHVYWRNPGDSGEPPKVTWELPAGVTAGPLHWPYPERISVPPLANYGYSGEVLLLVPLTVPKEFAARDLTVKARFSWLVCQKECIPGKADLIRQIPVLTENPPRSMWASSFDRTRKWLPLLEHEWKAQAGREGAHYVVDLTGPASGPKPVDIFPVEEGMAENTPAPQLSGEAGRYRFTLPVKAGTNPVPRFPAVVTLSNETAIEVEAPVGGEPWLAQMFLFALLGGMILNLMPCVFPVLSIKVLSFVNQSSAGRNDALAHSLSYSAGILVSFWILAGFLLAFRAGGAQLGWGFQLQSPMFLAVLAYLMVAVGLNLLGAFEVGGSFTGMGQSLTHKSGHAGSFFTGVLATVVATPCTAPFMGAAIGFALAQPAWVAVLVFSFLGIGMALPYVLLSAFPRLGRLLPRPGAWMVSFKELMAFPILATAVWLVTVMGQQTDMHYVLLLLEGLVVFSVGLWAWGKARSWKSATAVISALFVAGGIALGTQELLSYSPAAASAGKAAEGEWEPFSEDRLTQLLNEGKPVFIDFTAAWCITCQVNKRLVLNTPEVMAKFREKGVRLVRADWTNGDEAITRRLESYGRNGVPIYVLYPGKDPSRYELLPEVLTKDIVFESLQKL